MPEAGIAGYYDRLDRWNSVARIAGYGGGRGSLTVHRALVDPRHGDRATASRLHDILAETLPCLDGLRVLDAGCGLGGTMLDLAQRFGGTFVGLTLSPTQARIAEDAARRAGLADRVAVRVQSYDHPPSGPFDLMLAIESLAHSPAPATTLTALKRVLRPGGTLVIVDDMPDVEAAAGDLETFKNGWHCPAILSGAEWERGLMREGFQITINRDLTADCRPRSLSSIAWLLRVNRLAERLIPIRGWREVLASHRGGLALERLLRTGGVRYRMLVASTARSG